MRVRSDHEKIDKLDHETFRDEDVPTPASSKLRRCYMLFVVFGGSALAFALMKMVF